MTVAELIQILQGMPQDSLVLAENGVEGYEINSVNTVLATPTEEEDGEYNLLWNDDIENHENPENVLSVVTFRTNFIF